MKLGRGSGVAKTSNDSLVEVGLVIFQICSGQLIDYGTDSTGLAKGRVKCMCELRIIENIVSSPLVHIIEVILSLDRSDSLEPSEKLDERSLLFNAFVIL